MNSLPSILISVPPYFPKMTVSFRFTDTGVRSPDSLRRAYGDDFSALGLLTGRVRQDDAARRDLVLFQGFHQNAVVKGSNIHRFLLLSFV